MNRACARCGGLTVAEVCELCAHGMAPQRQPRGDIDAETRLRVVEVRSLYNQRICWILIATNVLQVLQWLWWGLS